MFVTVVCKYTYFRIGHRQALVYPLPSPPLPSPCLPLPQDEHEVSYLPLSHVAAQMLDIHAPLEKGITIWFAQPDALKGSLVQTLKVRTWMLLIVNVKIVIINSKWVNIWRQFCNKVCVFQAVCLVDVFYVCGGLSSIVCMYIERKVGGVKSYVFLLLN